MKNNFRIKILIILIFMFNACTNYKNNLWGFKPHFSTGTYIKAYAIIENAKINRMGLPKEEIDDMDNKIYNKYGFLFFSPNKISSYENKIKFYSDFKMIVGGKEYIIPKENIKERSEVVSQPRETRYEYFYDLPVDIIKTDDNEFILDIGEIEILSPDGKILKSRRKIAPILFKKTIIREYVKHYLGTDNDVYYRGWAEDYPKDPSKLKKLYNTREEIEKNITSKIKK